MTTLTVTARGQVTFHKDVLKHLGIGSGDRITPDLLPDGGAGLKAEKPEGSWDALHGILKSQGNGVRLTIEELNDAIADGGGRRRPGPGMNIIADTNMLLRLFMDFASFPCDSVDVMPLLGPKQDA